MNECPACAKAYSGNPPDCPSCGIFFAKWRPRSENPPPGAGAPSSSAKPLLAARQVRSWMPAVVLVVLLAGVAALVRVNLPLMGRLWERIGIMGQGQFTEKQFVDYIRQGEKAVVASFLKAGMSPDAAVAGETALSVAVQKARPDLVHLLLEAGADANKSDCSGMSGQCVTPLIAALFISGQPQSQKAIVDDLLAHGADPALADGLGRTPSSVAAKAGVVYLLNATAVAASPAPIDVLTLTQLSARFEAILASRDEKELNAIAAMGDAAVPVFVSALSPANREIASLGIQGLLRVPQPPASVEAPLLAYINDPMASMVGKAVEVLGRIPATPQEKVNRLLNLLNTSQSLEARGAAIGALGDMGPAAASALPDLQRVRDSDRELKPYARPAIAKIQGT